MDATKTDFWAGRIPCWEVRGCIAEARKLCCAFEERSLPCWEQETLCKKLFGLDTCFRCTVYLRYAEGRGQGEAAGEDALPPHPCDGVDFSTLIPPDTGEKAS